MKLAGGCLLVFLLSLFSAAVPAAGQITANCSNGCYGPALASDELANTTVGQYGNPGNVVSYRFRAHHTGSVQSLHVYLVGSNHPGYGAGTGGTIQVTFQTDDGTSAHNPSGRVLSTYVLTNPLNALPSKDFPTFTFSTPPDLVAGQLYHIVFKNIDSSPTVNYLSVDALAIQVPGTPAQPTISDIDAAELLSSGGSSWQVRKGYLPIYQLNFTDGSTEGIGYMESWIGAQQDISGSSNKVREQFTASGPQKDVGKVAIRMARISGSDPIVVKLQDSNGSVIEQGTIPTSNWTSTGLQTWGQYTFSTPRTLVPGNQYFLEFSTASSSTYRLFPERKGVDYWFDNTTWWDDGYAQFLSNGSWVGWTQWGITNRKDGDLQFYFEVAGTSATGTQTNGGPMISNLAAASITTSGAIVSWNTDQLASGQVQYGTTTAYAGSTTLNPAPANGHAQQLTGLAAGTLYHYRVLSANASGNQTVSGDLTFITAGADGTPGVGSSSATGTGPGMRLMCPSNPSNQCSAIVKPGETAVYNIELVPSSFSGKAALSCSGAPEGSFCVVSPDSVSLNADAPVPVTVKVTTKARSSVLLSVLHFHLDRMLWLAVLATVLFGLFGFAETRRRLKLRLAMLVLLPCLGCAGTPTTGANNVTTTTPSASSTLMITAVSGSTQASLPLTLILN